MNRNWARSAILPAILLARAWAENGEVQSENNAQPTDGFEEFRIITERNIFNPARSAAGRREAPPPPAETPAPAVRRMDLLGTWISETNRLAFISGESASVNRPLQVGEMVEDWKIDTIDTGQIVLARRDQRITWPVGRMIEQVGEGEWRRVEHAQEPNPFRPGKEERKSSGAASPDANDEVVRKMLERRLKEGGK